MNRRSLSPSLSLHFKQIKDLFIILESQSYREEGLERQSASVCQLMPQMATNARAEPVLIRSQEFEASSVSPT